MTPTTTHRPEPRPFQRAFIDRFVREARPGSVHVLVAPPGLGKAFTMSAALGQLLHNPRTQRALVLCPAALAHQWAVSLEQARVQALVIDSRALRLVKESSQGPAEAWPRGVCVMSVDLAKRSDARDAVTAVPWDVVVVDEAHVAHGQRGDLLESLATRSPAPALVLLTATPERLDLPGKDAITVDWTPEAAEIARGAEKSGLLRRVTVSYERSAEEAALMRDLYDYAMGLDGPTRRDLIERAASSIGALEERLVRVASQPQPTEIARQLLRRIENLGDDARLSRYLDLVRQLLAGDAPLVLTFCEHRATASYLEAALEGAGHATSVLHGGQSSDDRARTLAQVSSGPGVIVTTLAASQGVPWGAVDAFVHYDLPFDPAAVAERESRYRLSARSKPCTVYLLLDESKALPVESVLHRLADKLDIIHRELGKDVEEELARILG